MTIPGGIRFKLSLALLGIVGGALLAAYAIVVPSLERNLVEAKLDQQQSDAERLAVNYADVRRPEHSRLDEFVDAADFVSNSRVVVFSVIGPPGTQVLLSQADSSAVGGEEIEKDSTARAAAEAVRTVRQRVTHDGREYAEVAVPLYSGNVMLLSSSLSDQFATVALVKRRLLYATLVALLIAVVSGSPSPRSTPAGSAACSSAADRIAEGAFDEPVVDDGADEVGQLAGSFDRMRIQLAQLDRARKEFVANASHELRTPLFSLAGFLELLADEDLDEATRREFLATTRTQVDRLTELATDLLDLSRMDAGRIRIEHEEVSLGEVAAVVIEETAGPGRRLGPSRRLGRTTTSGRSRTKSGCSRSSARSSATRSCTRRRGTAVDLRVERRGARVRVGVRDNGPGIPPGASRPDLPAVLPRRGRTGLRQRPRSRYRP